MHGSNLMEMQYQSCEFVLAIGDLFISQRDILRRDTKPFQLYFILTIEDQLSGISLSEITPSIFYRFDHNERIKLKEK